MRILIGAGLLGLALLPAPPARAETFHTCEGFIDSLPAVINTQGTWCLRGDLATGISAGYAITINTNNATLDCNGYKLGNLAAGLASSAGGVFASSRTNIAVRGCNIRGFQRGVFLVGSGHRVEHSRFEGAGQAGITLIGDSGLVADNVVVDTGGKPGYTSAYGIYVDGADHVVQRNFVRGVTPEDSGDGYATGMFVFSGVVADNTVIGMVPAGAGYGRGITVGPDSVVQRNSITQSVSTTGNGVFGWGDTLCRDNNVIGYGGTPLVSCGSAINNLSMP